ncbi:MAG: ATP-binding cassette domain-containing protein [Ruthenibacterium lactatiformans]
MSSHGGGFRGCGPDPAGCGEACRRASGGQRRRVALLRALLAPADVVVLDEPFKGLDEAARRAAAACAAYVAGRTLLCITHEEGDAALLARGCPPPEAAEQGRTIRKGRSRDKRLRPFNVWTTKFLNLSERCGTRRQARK